MFVVCHMLASLDGKIDGAFFGAPETAPALHAYGELRGFYHCQATLYGTTTMLGGYADGLVPALPPHGPVAFSLQGAKAFTGNGLWLRYTAVKD